MKIFRYLAPYCPWLITVICDTQVQTLVSEFSSGSPCLILKEAGPVLSYFVF